MHLLRAQLGMRLLIISVVWVDGRRRDVDHTEEGFCDTTTNRLGLCMRKFCGRGCLIRGGGSPFACGKAVRDAKAHN